MIEVQGLRKRFGAVEALRGVDLRVRRGEVFGLVGPDGAGKTTLLRSLCGVLGLQAGEVRIAGLDLATQSEQIKAHLGYMAQRFSLYEDLTVRENLAFFADLFGVERAVRSERSAELLRFSRLEAFEGRLAQHLSGGMKQKLALACTLMHRPELLLLDEPTTGVDPVSRREFWQILHSLLEQGITMLYATPYMDEAERCDTVAFLSNGQVIACAPPKELKQLMRGTIVEVRGSPPERVRELTRTLVPPSKLQTFGDKLHVTTDDPSVLMARLRERFEGEGLEPASMREVPPSLEDVFLQLTSSQSSGISFQSQDLRGPTP